MAKAKTLRGKDLMVFLDGKAQALATNCQLTITRETIDAKTKDDGQWNDADPGDMGWEISTDALVSADVDAESFDKLFDAMISGTPVQIVFGVPTNKSDSGVPDDGWKAPTAGCYTGSLTITQLQLTGQKGDNAQYSMSGTGKGELKRVPKAA